MVPRYHSTLVKNVVQLKIIADDEVVEKFKRIVLAKHGKLELSVEGEEALKLYIGKYEHFLSDLCPPEEDPLTRIAGIGCSEERRNVLKDLKRLEAGEL